MKFNIVLVDKSITEAMWIAPTLALEIHLNISLLHLCVRLVFIIIGSIVVDEEFIEQTKWRTYLLNGTRDTIIHS